MNSLKPLEAMLKDEESHLKEARNRGDFVEEVHILQEIGKIYFALECFQQAFSHFDEALRLSKRMLNQYMKKHVDVSRKLDEISKTDIITGLTNQHEMIDIIQNEQSRCERNGRCFVLILSYIDHFHTIIEKNGYECSENVLFEVGKILRSFLRLHDHIASWNGNAFLILLPETSITNGIVVSERIRKTIASTPFKCKDDEELFITMTLNVTSWNASHDIKNYLAYIDEILHQKRRDCKNCVLVVDGDKMGTSKK